MQQTMKILIKSFQLDQADFEELVKMLVRNALCNNEIIQPFYLKYLLLIYNNRETNTQPTNT